MPDGEVGLFRIPERSFEGSSTSTISMENSVSRGKHISNRRQLKGAYLKLIKVKFAFRSSYLWKNITILNVGGYKISIVSP